MRSTASPRARSAAASRQARGAMASQLEHARQDGAAIASRQRGWMKHEFTCSHQNQLNRSLNHLPPTEIVEEASSKGHMKRTHFAARTLGISRKEHALQQNMSKKSKLFARASISDLDEDVVGLVLERIGSQVSLIRAASTCKRWRRIIADAAFLRRFRSLHAPTVAGTYHNDTVDGERESKGPVFIPSPSLPIDGRRRHSLSTSSRTTARRHGPSSTAAAGSC
ncbi:hypothetical protein EJB05_00770, partial [Eragrostis curvula]